MSIAGAVAGGAARAAGRAAIDGTRIAANVARAQAQANRRVNTMLAAQRAASGTAGTVIARRPASAAARAPEQRVPGDQLLDLLRQWLGTYARFPSPAALDAVTLWVAHTHMRDEHGVLVFRASPRLYLLSSEPGSGKTQVLELLGLVCPATFGLDLEPTAAGLVFTISREHATVLIDEGDVLFGSGSRKAAVRAIINGGYTRHGTTLNGKASKATRASVFGALALAGLDTIEKATGDTLAALLSRGIRIGMRRAARDDQPSKVTRVTETQGAKLRGWLEVWAGQVRDGAADAEPEPAEGVYGRAAQIWEPLLAVADAAGGEWPDRARGACEELVLAQMACPDDGDVPYADEFAAFAAEFSR